MRSVQDDFHSNGTNKKSNAANEADKVGECVENAMWLTKMDLGAVLLMRF